VFGSLARTRVFSTPRFTFFAGYREYLLRQLLNACYLHFVLASTTFGTCYVYNGS
jgi:hypothetical protein